VSKLPCRSVINAASGSGKTVLITNLILDVYRHCFSRICIFSPSIDIDDTWIPVNKYIDDEFTKTKDEQIYYQDFDGEAVQHILTTQKNIIDHQKKDHKTKKLFQARGGTPNFSAGKRSESFNLKPQSGHLG
jgi:late competence protein required for DNA uptake (superfamily II DNA/RNA helicase)